MHETPGTLNLKIARLEQFLKVLEQQQRMSSPYPDYQVELKQQVVRLQAQLQRLIQDRCQITQNSYEF